MFPGIEYRAIDPRGSVALHTRDVQDIYRLVDNNPSTHYSVESRTLGRPKPWGQIVVPIPSRRQL